MKERKKDEINLPEDLVVFVLFTNYRYFLIKGYMYIVGDSNKYDINQGTRIATIVYHITTEPPISTTI